MAKEKVEEKTFEESLVELESIVKELESGNVDLDQAINKYSDAMKLAKICNDKLNNVRSSYVLKNPLATYEVQKENIVNLENILNKIVVSKIDVSKHKYEVMINKLDLLNPLNILSKGYSLVTCDNNVIKSSKDLKIDDTINIKMHEGKVKAIVKEID